MKQISNKIIKIEGFIVHLLTFTLFLIGQIPNIILDVKMGIDYENTKLFDAMAIINNFTASLSEVCLLIIFNQLCVNNKQTMRRVSVSTSGET